MSNWEKLTDFEKLMISTVHLTQCILYEISMKYSRSSGTTWLYLRIKYGRGTKMWMGHPSKRPHRRKCGIMWWTSKFASTLWVVLRINNPTQMLQKISRPSHKWNRRKWNGSKVSLLLHIQNPSSWTGADATQTDKWNHIHFGDGWSSTLLDQMHGTLTGCDRRKD